MHEFIKQIVESDQQFFDGLVGHRRLCTLLKSLQCRPQNHKKRSSYNKTVLETKRRGKPKRRKPKLIISRQLETNVVVGKLNSRIKLKELNGKN